MRFLNGAAQIPPAPSLIQNERSITFTRNCTYSPAKTFGKTAVNFVMSLVGVSNGALSIYGQRNKRPMNSVWILNVD